MRVWVLGSGSRGNAVLIESRGTRVLIDAGFAPRVLAERLATVDIAPESITALVITHEHTDHVKGARVAAAKWGWSIHGTPGTITAARDLRDSGAIPFRPGDVLAFDDLSISTVRASHDAAEPVVLVATSARSGARAGIAYDLGTVTGSVFDAFRDLDVLVLEANHDDAMLQTGPYPTSVRERIAGRNGHLSNRAAAQLVKQTAHRGLRHVVLAHLSESCNTAALAVAAVNGAVGRGRAGVRVCAAPQHAAVGPFEPGAGRSGAVQLALGF